MPYNVARHHRDIQPPFVAVSSHPCFSLMRQNIWQEKEVSCAALPQDAGVKICSETNACLASGSTFFLIEKRWDRSAPHYCGRVSENKTSARLLFGNLMLGILAAETRH